MHELKDILEKYIQSQNARGARIRVWSLVVTIFGDAIEPRGGVLRLGALQQITNRIGIESNALRTAMSRLASDGWLERQRIGRASFYHPSQMASRENAAASHVIYNFFPLGWNGNWLFALAAEPEGFALETKRNLHSNNFAFTGRKLAIAPDLDTDICVKEIPGALMFNAKSRAADGTDAISRDLEFHYDSTGSYNEFLNTASSLLSTIENIGNYDSLDAMVLRSLLVHNWRRIVLKDVYWPAQLRKKDWPGFAAQHLMRNLYRRLLKPSEQWLSQVEGTPSGKLPAAGKELLRRFSE